MELEVTLSEEAVEDLSNMGALTRNLVSQALRDELRTSEPSLLASKEQDQEVSDAQVLPIGNYRVLFRSIGPPEKPSRLVIRVVHRDELDRAKVAKSEDAEATA